jgi:hypothetical protein
MIMKNLLLILCLLWVSSTYGQYCMSGGPSSIDDSNTEIVTLNGTVGSINYTGCPGQVGIEDYTATQQVSLAANTSYNIDIQFGSCGGNYGNFAEAWIDFNGNEIFETTESILQWQGNPPSLQNFNFIVPASAITGATRMRIMQHETNTTFPLDPCASFTWGSVLDFTVNIQGGGSCFTVNSFPYTQGFEGSLGGWFQETADSIDWMITSGTTPSAGTGPTGASEGISYAYTESSTANNGSPSKIANLVSPCFDLTSLNNPGLRFMYHMYGATMGSLNLQVSVGGSSWATIWNQTGDQGDAWTPVVISLAAYSSATDLRLRFNGTTGSSFTSDMAIDAITINCSGFAGDNTPDAIPITSYPYVDTNSTLNCYNNFSLVYASPDVFYLAVLDPSKDSLKASLCGSSFDTHLSIQNMNGDAIYYNDDFAGCGAQSEILFPTAGLDSVYIIVEGWGTLAGNFILNVDNSYVSTMVDVNDIQTKENAIKIFPNPTNSTINVSGIIPEQIVIYSLDGKKMQPFATNSNSIDVSSLPTGMYILELLHKGRFIREKIIKQ